MRETDWVQSLEFEDIDLSIAAGSIAPWVPKCSKNCGPASAMSLIFQKKGIIFKDITPILSDGALFRTSIDVFLQHCQGKKIDKVVGIDARGFLFGSAVAYELGAGFVPIRKRGKLPFKTEIAKYSLEYGEAEMEMHIDAMAPGEQVVLIDDLLATGGTSAAAAALIKKVGGHLMEAIFLIELGFLNGREKLAPVPTTSFLTF